MAENIIGYPALGIMTIDELVWVAKRVANLATIPLLVDVDKRYGDSPLNIVRNIERLLKVGAAGFAPDNGMGISGYAHLAKSVNDVRDGVRAQPYQVFSTEHWLAKVKAALDVVARMDCLLIARMEARPIPGLNDAIDRCRRAQDLGVPMTLVNRFHNIDECRRAAKAPDDWKMYPNVFIRPDGSLEVQLEDICMRGFNYATMHYMEKSAMYGMLDNRKKNFANGTTVYSELHDTGGLTAVEKKEVFSSNTDVLLEEEIS